MPNIVPGFGLLRNSSGFVELRRDKPPRQASPPVAQSFFRLINPPAGRGMACQDIKKKPSDFLQYLNHNAVVRLRQGYGVTDFTASFAAVNAGGVFDDFRNE